MDVEEMDYTYKSRTWTIVLMLALCSGIGIYWATKTSRALEDLKETERSHFNYAEDRIIKTGKLLIAYQKRIEVLEKNSTEQDKKIAELREALKVKFKVEILDKYPPDLSRYRGQK